MLNTTKTMQTWAQHATELNIARPTTRAEYERLLELIETITDSVDDLERNPYSALLDLVMQYAHDWEDIHEPLPTSSTPRDALAFWMDQHGMTQKDLERAGVADQPTLSKILAGEREISKTVAKKLGEYFKVSPAEFL
jgi:HTH-type transcriptional regulator / antitoxin HigA